METNEPAGELDPGEVNRHVQRIVKPLLAESARMRLRVLDVVLLQFGLTNTQSPKPWTAMPRALDSAQKPAEDTPAP